MNNKAKFSTRMIVSAALLIALDVVLARFLRFYTPGALDRISLQFLPNALAGAMFGPIGGALICVLGDVVGMLINSDGFSFMPLITLACAARGLIYGLVFYKRDVTFPRALIAVAIVTLVVELGMMPVFLSVLYGNAWWATLIGKLPWRIISIPAFAGVLAAVFRALKSAKVLPRRQKT